jgi:hypothetical protein
VLSIGFVGQAANNLIEIRHEQRIEEGSQPDRLAAPCLPIAQLRATGWKPIR